MSAVSEAPTVESIVAQYKKLSEDDRRLVMREMARMDFIAFCDKIAEGPEPPMPVTDEELNEIVHEARAEMLRARGL